MRALPADAEWVAELARRARADPSGGEAWDVVDLEAHEEIAPREGVADSDHAAPAQKHRVYGRFGLDPIDATKTEPSR